MQNTYFLFFEGNNWGRKKERGKKKKEETFEHHFLRANRSVWYFNGDFLDRFCSCEYKTCVPEMQAHPAPGELAVMGRLEESVSTFF